MYLKPLNDKQGRGTRPAALFVCLPYISWRVMLPVVQTATQLSHPMQSSGFPTAWALPSTSSNISFGQLLTHSPQPSQVLSSTVMIYTVVP